MVFKILFVLVVSVAITEFVSGFFGRPRLWLFIRKWQLENMYGPLDGVRIAWQAYDEDGDSVPTSCKYIVYYWKKPKNGLMYSSRAIYISAGFMSLALFYGIRQGIMFYPRIWKLQHTHRAGLRVDFSVTADADSGLNLLPVTLYLDQIGMKQMVAFNVPRVEKMF